MTDRALVELVGVGRTFAASDAPVLDGVDLVVKPGDRIVIVGPSGSGKSTLLNLIGLLDTPTSGEVRLNGDPTAGLDDDARSRLRRETLGFVFQDHHLLPQLTALQNVLVPAWADGSPTSADEARAKALLGELGLADRLNHLPSQLSTGQRQRVAVARALFGAPKVLLADEPTGSLDRPRALALVERLASVDPATAVVVVTHDPEVAAAFPVELRLGEGRLTVARGEA